MNEFRTELKPHPSAQPIKLGQKLVTLGSCFADSIGNNLAAHKFSVSVNPFGVTYNPLSIHRHLMRAIYNQPAPGTAFLSRDGIHLNYDHHSQFSALTRADLEAALQQVNSHCHHFLQGAHHVILTYGTAWAYERLDNGDLVANCHKIPSTQFRKILLTQKRIIESFEEMHKAARAFNSDIRFILTVSPVRHLKDTLELNSVSKSVLRLACHTLSELYPNVEYFPAYEILLDDLRDYRFYDADMLHPSPAAIDYIWQKFSNAYFDDATQTILSKWHHLAKSISHIPFHNTSPAHQRFLIETLRQFDELRPLINVDEEIKTLQAQLIKT